MTVNVQNCIQFARKSIEVDGKDTTIRQAIKEAGFLDELLKCPYAFVSCCGYTVYSMPSDPKGIDQLYKILDEYGQNCIWISINKPMRSI